MSYVVFNSRKHPEVQTRKARIAGNEIVENVIPVKDTEWLLIDEEANLFLKMSLKYWGAKNGGRRAFPCFQAPEYQILGRASDLTGAMRETYKPVAEALEKREVSRGDTWDSCWQENDYGYLVPAGNGDFFSPQRTSFIPECLAFDGKREVKLPNFFRHLMSGKTLGFKDGDDKIFSKIQHDAESQIRSALIEKAIPYYEESIDFLYSEMEGHPEKEEVTGTIPTKDLCLHEFRFEWSGKILRHLNLYVLEGIANDGDSFNRVQVHFESHNKSMMFKIFKKLGVVAK